MDMTNVNINTSHRQISWGSIIGGTVTVIAVAMLLATLGTALGFTVITPLSENPMNGFGTAFSLWSAVIMIVSLAAGGYVAGRLARHCGMLHGFLVWAVAFITMAIISSYLVGTTIKNAGQAVDSALSATGSAAASMASGLGSGITDLTDGLNKRLEDDLNIDFDKASAQAKINQILRDTNQPALQPQYLEQQMDGAKSDIKAALNQLRLQPSNYEAIFSGLSARLKNRLDNLPTQINRSAVVSSLTKNTDMTPQEANDFANDMADRYEYGVAAAKQNLTDLQLQLQNTQENVKQMVQQARETADDATKAIAKSALIAFFALLIGAIVSSVAGMFGSRNRLHHQETTYHHIK